MSEVPRDEKGRILPGHTLNPGGRPRKKNFGDYFSEEEKEALILRIKQELGGKPKGDIVKMTVEQIFGKPKQPIIGGDEDDPPIKITDDRYEQILRNIAGRKDSGSPPSVSG